MNDPIDGRIRELYAELDRAAPPLPPMPVFPPKPDPRYRRFSSLAAAAAVILVLVGVPALILNLGGGDDADTAATDLAAPSTAAGTTSAPGGDVDAGGAEAPSSRTAELEDRCGRFVTGTAGLPAELDSLEDYGAAFALVEQLVTDLGAIAAADESTSLAVREALSAMRSSLEGGRGVDVAEAAARYGAVVEDVGKLAESLSATGAAACADIAAALP